MTSVRSVHWAESYRRPPRGSALLVCAHTDAPCLVPRAKRAAPRCALLQRHDDDDDDDNDDDDDDDDDDGCALAAAVAMERTFIIATIRLSLPPSLYPNLRGGRVGRKSTLNTNIHRVSRVCLGVHRVHTQ